MRSLIILEVEHGEDTDLLDAMIAHTLHHFKAGDCPDGTNGHLIDYTVKIDIPDCYRMVK